MSREWKVKSDEAVKWLNGKGKGESQSRELVEFVEFVAPWKYNY